MFTTCKHILEKLGHLQQRSQFITNRKVHDGLASTPTADLQFDCTQAVLLDPPDMNDSVGSN